MIVFRNFYFSHTQVALVEKNPSANAGDTGDTVSIPGWGRSPGEGNGNPFSILAREIPFSEEPGGLQSMGSQRVGCDQVCACVRAHTHVCVYWVIMENISYRGFQAKV